MKNTIGILREGINKKGEKRVAITPHSAKKLIDHGFTLIVQPAKHPETGEIKRAFADSAYRKIGARIEEDLSPVKVIFGLKEIPIHRILPEKVYLLFSHTHKGQIKNRKMLKMFVENKSTIIDYELIRDEKDRRLITAFTYNAGYAGMVDSLWALGQRLKMDGIENPFKLIPQAIDGEDLLKVKKIFEHVAKKISSRGTPKQLLPMIFCFLGKGKTAHGARTMFDILPHKNISINELPTVFEGGNRKQLYALQIDVEEIYRIKKEFGTTKQEYDKLNVREKQHYYFNNQNYFESNLDKILPYVSVIMNCILWSPEYPRTITKKLLKSVYIKHKTLKVIGDITCDPNGSIEFSKETWIDDPVFIYNPITKEIKDSFEGEGIAVMAVTNLPCEFSADASREFSEDLLPYLKEIAGANYKDELDNSNLPTEIKRAVILWKGRFTKDFRYMREYTKKE